jgi:hypothetical protein
MSDRKISSFYILPGDIFGFLALFFIATTALFMLARKRILRYSRNLELLRRIHVYLATLGGLFLILHVAYFITYPITSAITLGYVATGAAAIVWLTGMAFLERFRDTLIYHGSLSFAALSLIVIHAMSAGINLPVVLVYTVLALTSSAAILKGSQHAEDVLKMKVGNKK